MKGTFQARAIASESGLRESPEKKTKFFSILFEIVEGEHKGERFEWKGWLTEKASPRTIDSLLYCGFEGDDLNNPKGIDTNIVPIVLDEEPYTTDAGEERIATRVAWVNDPNRRVGLGVPIAEPEAKSFADTMKGAIMAQREKRGQPVPDDGDKFDFGANAPPPKKAVSSEASKPSKQAGM